MATLSRPSLDEFLSAARPRNPGLSDDDLTDYYQENYGQPVSTPEPVSTPSKLPSLPTFLSAARDRNPDVPEHELRAYWQEEYGSKGAKETEPPPSGILRRAADIPIGIVKGVVDLPKIITGLADIPTSGGAGRATTAILDAMGQQADQLGLPTWARPSQWSAELANLYSPETKAAVAGAAEETRQSIEQAKTEGAGPGGEILAGVTGTVKGLFHHPAAAVPLIAENLAQMGVIAKGTALALKPFSIALNAEVLAGTKTAEEASALLGKVAIKYASVGEGLMSAGQVSSQISAENPRADFVHRLAAVIAGTTTALITRGVAKIPGLGDIEASMAAKSLGGTVGFAGSVPERIAKGILAEGILQELPQSAQEQLWQNLATGKPWQEGLGEQAVQGLLAGGVLGGAGAALVGPAVVSKPLPPPKSAPEMAQALVDQYARGQDPLADPSMARAIQEGRVQADLETEAETAQTRAESLYRQQTEQASIKDILSAPTVDDAIATAGKILDADTTALAKPPTKRPSLDVPILPEAEPTGPFAPLGTPTQAWQAEALTPPLVTPGQAFTPRAEPTPDPREAIAAERAKLLAMKKTSPKPIEPQASQPVETPVTVETQAPLRTALSKAYPSVQDLHALATEKGFDTEGSTFKEYTKLSTGKAHLDDLTPFELQQLANKLVKIKSKDVQTSLPKTPTVLTAEGTPALPLDQQTERLSTFDAAQVPRGTLIPEQNAELLARAEKAQADLEIAGSERGGRYFNETQGKGSDQEITGLRSATAQWYREATSGQAALSRKRVEVAVEKIIKDRGRDVGKDVARIKELLLLDREFRKSPFAPKTDADWKALIAEATHGPLQESSVPEGSPDAPVVSTDNLLDLVKTESFRSQGLSSLDVPRQRQVMALVFGSAKDLKVRDAIIRSLPVDMVDALRREQRTPEMLFHDKAMFLQEFSVDSNLPVSVRIDAANAAVRVVAELAAKEVRPTASSASSENRAASDTSKGRQDVTPSSDVKLGTEAASTASVPPTIPTPRKKATAPQSPAYAALPAKTRETFESAWTGAEQGDRASIRTLREWLYLSNKTLRGEFERRSGITLPKGLAATNAAVEEYFSKANAAPVAASIPAETTAPAEEPKASDADTFTLKAQTIKPPKAKGPEQLGFDVPAPTIGERPIIGREAQPDEAPLFSRAAQIPEPKQTTLPEAAAPESGQWTVGDAAIAKIGKPYAAGPKAPTAILAEALRSAADQIEGVKSKISDVGEHIGGSRKDLAEKTGPTGPKVARPKDDIPTWRKRYVASQILKSARPGEEGKWSLLDTKKTDFAGRPERAVRTLFDTKEEAEAAIPLAAVSRNHRVYKAKGEQWEIYRKIGDRKIVQVVEQSFPTEEDAQRYMIQHAESIIETKTNFGEEILPRPETVTRTGEDRRNGKNVEANDFKDTFNFRAVEFGNWQNQDDRQAVMNHAYDGLLDLAGILHIPPKAIGLNGELALAFGARGHGLTGAAAHYEREYGVINLTKMEGAGHLAHEWFHSTDHYFGRQDKKAKSAKIRNDRGDLVYDANAPSTDYVSHGFSRKDSGVREEVRAAYTTLIDTMFTRAEQYTEDAQKVERFVGEARNDVESKLNEIRNGPYGGLSRQLDEQYYKRKAAPATAEQLAEFDGIAAKILAGEFLSTEFKVSDAKNKTRRYLASGRWTNEALEKLSAIQKTVRGRSGFGSGDVRGVFDDLRGYMNRYSERLKMLSDAQSGTEKIKRIPTEYAREAKSIDQGRVESYWLTPHEMAARAFAAYVEDTLAAKGQHNDFIAYGTHSRVPTPWGWKQPYPAGEERKAINTAFDALFDTMQTKETDQGTALFERRGNSDREPTMAQFEQGIEAGSPIGDTGQKVIDSSQQFPEEMMRDLASKPYVKRVSERLREVFEELADTLSASDTDFGSPTFVGLSPDDYYHGVNLRGSDQVILNPWGLLWSMQQAVERGRITEEELAEHTAAAALKTLMHELTHQQVITSHKDERAEHFARQLDQNYAIVGLATLQRLQRRLMEALDGGPHARSIDDLARDLDAQRPFWLGGDGLSDKNFSRDAESGPSFDRQNVADGGRGKGTGPPANLRGRSRVPSPALDDRAAVQRRGTSPSQVEPKSATLPSMATNQGPGSSDDAQVPPEPGRDDYSPSIPETYTPTILHDPVLNGPLRLRISDDRSHAENFEASTIDEFSANLLDALERFKAWSINRHPIHQERKREDAARVFDATRLSIHLRDSYWEVAKDPSRPHWMIVSNGDMRPVVSEKAWFRDGAKTMWRAVEYTFKKNEKWARFMGYHPSGEDQFGDFLKNEGENPDDSGPQPGGPVFERRRQAGLTYNELRSPEFPGIQNKTPAPYSARHAHLGALTETQQTALQHVHGTPKTWHEKLDSFKQTWKQTLQQGLFDQYAPILDYSKKAYILSRMTKAGDGTLEALLLYGKPYVDSDGAYRVDYREADGMNGFSKVLSALHGEQDRFMEWVAAQRADRLKAIGLENLYREQDIAALKTLNRGTMKNGASREAAYLTALRELNSWNDAMVKIGVDSGLISPEVRDLYKNQPYVPFYRLHEEGVAPGFGIKPGLVNQYAWKKLEGGTEHLNDDLLANLLQNWSHLITASAKNRAAKETLNAAVMAGVAQEVPSGSTEKDLVHYMDQGKPVTFRVTDPALLDAIAALHYAGLGAIAKPFQAMKRYFSFAVTVNPAYKIRNLIRDSIQAIGTADLSYNPLENIREGIKGTRLESETRAQLLAGGGMMRFGTMLDGNNADRTRRLIEQGVDPDSILSDAGAITKFWKQRIQPAFEAYQEFGDRGEQVNRAALYQRLLSKGMSHQEATFWARDLMDFSLSGKWAAVRILTQVVPFTGARLQGLYKLGRATKEDYRRMGTTLATVALASIALMLAYKDDDDWKKRQPYDRENNWWFKVAGVAFRIPKPFEIGAIGTIAERSVEYLIDQEMTGKFFGERLAAVVSNQLSMNPTPQLLKPLMDLYANKDAFTGQPIERPGMERLRKQDRYTERTSEIARMLGQLGLPDPTQLAMGRWDSLSPVQVDALVRGYFSWLGTMGTTVLDYGIRPMVDRGTRPNLALKDVFLAGNFVETLPSGSSKYLTQFYDQALEVEQAFGSYRDALKRGDLEGARTIREQEREKLALYPMIERVKREESSINTRIKMVEQSRVLSGEQKRVQIDRLREQKNRLAKMVSDRQLALRH